MIYELRTYQLAAGKLPEYLALVKTEVLPLVAEHGLKPQGFWYTEIGTLNEVVHLWPYSDLNDRQQKWASLAQDPRRGEILSKLPILSQNNKILSPTEFSELK